MSTVEIRNRLETMKQQTERTLSEVPPPYKEGFRAFGNDIYAILSLMISKIENLERQTKK